MHKGISFCTEGKMSWVIFILTILNAGITSGNIVVTPKVPEVNQTAIISCYVPAPRQWYLPVGLVTCNYVACYPDSYGSYTFRADSSKTEFIFQSLNRARDERVWTCIQENTNYSTNLLIYTIPRGLDLTQTPDMNVDLGMASITIQCRTTSCTYPQPSIEWLYQDQTNSNTYEIYTRTIPSSTQGPCILPEKIYTGSISISQNTTWSDHSDKTVTFLCRIGYSDPSKNITSLASKPIHFAVRVTEAFLQYNNQNITSILTVTSGEQVILMCMTGTSRPSPNIDWYIGSRSKGSGTSLIFTPSDTDHNEVIYCQAYNIDPNLKVDSNKPILFVRVRVTEAFLQQNNQNITSTLTVTSGKQFTLTCLTSTRRPAPNIDWYIGSYLVGNGTNLIFTPNNTNHNNVIYCQAYNPNPKVDSNKANLFVRVYVSWITLDGSTDGTIVFNEGYPQTLKCISSPSRPMPIIRWLLGNKQVTDNITNSDIMDTNGLHVLTSEITLVLMRNNSNQKVYCEGFISGQGTTVMSTQVSVDVQYAPDVKVNLSGYTVVGTIAVLMCVPQGKPPQYTFHHWIHRVGQIEIRRLNGVNTFSFSTLTLSNIDIQDMGTYICTVDNSITGLDGQVNQMGDAHVYVQGVPVIGEMQSTFTGEYNNSASLEIPFYSYFSIKTVKFIKQFDSLEILNTSETSIFIQPSNITMMFYNKKVMIPGHVAVLHFRNLKDTDFDNYLLQISNDLGTVSMQFDLTVSGPPLKVQRFYFNSFIDDQIELHFDAGFNGGSEQTFVIEYMSETRFENGWKNTSASEIREKESQYRFPNGTFFVKVITPSPGNYIYRMYSWNVKGRSPFSGNITVTIQAPNTYESIVNPVPAIAGGVSAGFVVILILCIGIFLWRRNRPPKETDQASTLENNRNANTRPTDSDLYEKLNSNANSDIQMYSSLKIQIQSEGSLTI